MSVVRSRLLTVLAVVAGLALVSYGHALHRTKLAVRTDLGPEPPPTEPAQETAPDEVELPAADDWDDDGKDDGTLDELDAELDAISKDDDEWDDDEGEADALTKELDAEAETAPKPQEEETVVVTDGGLIRGAVMGIVVRLPDGRLALTWLGDATSDAPACPT